MGWKQLPSQRYLQLCKLGATTSSVHMSLSYSFFSVRSSILPKDTQPVDGRASIQTLVLFQGHSLPHVQK